MSSNENAFLLWFASLDPFTVAANESFHSAKHRAEMKRHEFHKMSIRIVETPRFPIEQANDTPKRERKSSTRTRVKIETGFTARQIEIASAAMEKQNG